MTPVPLYAAARAVLLDALEALGDQRDALVLAGAQAIYLHTSHAALAVAEYTKDGDIVIEPSRLKPDPRLLEAMSGAGFRQGGQPGLWLKDRDVRGITTSIPVDLLVPEAVAGSGRRSADLGGHGARAGRRVRGLEGALIDNAMRRLSGLEPGDERVCEIRVAGPAALLVAKLHKLADRSAEAGGKRLYDKDALDVLRLLRAVDMATMRDGIQGLRRSEVAGEVAEEAVAHLRTLFASADGLGVTMAVRGAEGIEDPVGIGSSCVALAEELLDE
jgi:hypothetical protein